MFLISPERWINCPDEQSSNRKIANLEEITEDTICEDLQAKTKRTGPIERNMVKLFFNCTRANSLLFLLINFLGHGRNNFTYLGTFRNRND